MTLKGALRLVVLGKQGLQTGKGRLLPLFPERDTILFPIDLFLDILHDGLVVILQDHQGAVLRLDGHGIIVHAVAGILPGQLRLEEIVHGIQQAVLDAHLAFMLAGRQVVDEDGQTAGISRRAGVVVAAHAGVVVGLDAIDVDFKDVAGGVHFVADVIDAGLGDALHAAGVTEGVGGGGTRRARPAEEVHHGFHVLGHHLVVVFLVQLRERINGGRRRDDQQAIGLAGFVRIGLDAHVGQVGEQVAGQDVVRRGARLITGRRAGKHGLEARIEELHAVVALQKTALLGRQLGHAVVVVFRVGGRRFRVLVVLGEGLHRRQETVHGIQEGLHAFLQGLTVGVDVDGGLADALKVDRHAFDDVRDRVGGALQLHGPVVHRVDGIGGLLDVPVVGIRDLAGDAGAREGHDVLDDQLSAHDGGIQALPLQLIQHILHGGTAGQRELHLRTIVLHHGVLKIRRRFQQILAPAGPRRFRRDGAVGDGHLRLDGGAVALMVHIALRQRHAAHVVELERLVAVGFVNDIAAHLRLDGIQQLLIGLVAADLDGLGGTVAHGEGIGELLRRNGVAQLFAQLVLGEGQGRAEDLGRAARVVHGRAAGRRLLHADAGGHAAAPRGRDAFHAGKAHIPAAVIRHGHVGRIARGLGQGGQKFLAGRGILDRHGNGALVAVALVHHHVEGQIPPGAAIDQRLGHVLLRPGIDLDAGGHVGVFRAFTALEGLHAVQLQIAAGVKARDLAPRLGIDGIHKVVQRGVALDGDALLRAVVVNKVKHEIAGVGEHFAEIDFLAGGPGGTRPGSGHAFKGAVVDDEVVFFPGILAGHLEQITAARLHRADGDPRIVLGVVHQAHEGVQRGVGRDGDGHRLAAVGELEVHRIVGLVDDVVLGREDMLVRPDGIAGHLLYVDGVLHVLGVGVGRARHHTVIGAGHQLGDEVVAVLERSDLALGALGGLDDLAEGLIAQVPVVLPGLKAIELDGLNLLELFQGLSPVGA